MAEHSVNQNPNDAVPMMMVHINAPIGAEVENAVAIANAPNDKPSSPATPPPATPPPPICGMNVDCYGETFDYMGLKDLRAVGQTCKHMNAVVVDIFKKSYPAINGCLKNGVIKTVDGIHLHGFNRVIRFVSVCDGKMYDFAYIAKNNFDSLRYIEFIHTDLSRIYIDRIKEILKQIEFLRLTYCKFTGDFNQDIMMKYCVNLKCLHIFPKRFNDMQKIIIGNGNEWLNQKYPKLEEFKLCLISFETIAGLGTFFVQNSQLTKLTINIAALTANKSAIVASELKLKCFEVMLGPYAIPIDLLNELHAKGFYQRLEITDVLTVSFRSDSVTQISLLHGLEKMQFSNHIDDDALETVAKWINLKCLSFSRHHLESSFTKIAMQLINLEWISFNYVTEESVCDFIFHSAKLKTIILVDFDCNALLNLSKWNENRVKLNEAKKLKIYVQEQVYLNTKWALKKTNFGLIEIKRIDSIVSPFARRTVQ